MAFAWSKDIETGNFTIDTEHKELLLKIDNLLSACNQGKGREEILNTIQFLKNYTATHLAHEEELQRCSKYPDYVNHKRLHQNFTDTVNRIEKKLKEEGSSVVLVGEINQQIGTWFISHIKTEDMKLAKHLAQSES